MTTGSFDDDGPEETDYHPETDDAGVFWCPACGAEIYGDSPRCPKCGEYVTPGARGASGKPWWVWVGLIAIALGLVGAFIAAALR